MPAIIRIVILLVVVLAARDSLAASPALVPALPGSLAPNLAMGGDGTLVLSWLEPDGVGHRLRYARWAGAGWGDPHTVARGDNWFVNWADFPSVVPIDKQFWVAHWLVRRPAGGYAYDVVVALSEDGGDHFGAPFRPYADDSDTEHGFVSLFPDGDGAGLVWLDGRHMHEDGRGMTLRAARLTTGGGIEDQAELDSLTCDCCQNTTAVSDDGPVAVYRNRTPAEIRDIYIARRIDGEWHEGQPVADDGWTIGGCPVNGPAVAARDHEVVVAWFTAADDAPRVRLARSADSTAPFGDPVDVAAGTALGRVGLVLLDDGAAVVSLLQAAGEGTAELQLVRVSQSGEPGAPLVVARGLPAFSVPQLAVAGDELLLAWTSRQDGTSRVASARIALHSLD